MTHKEHINQLISDINRVMELVYQKTDKTGTMLSHTKHMISVLLNKGDNLYSFQYGDISMDRDKTNFNFYLYHTYQSWLVRHHREIMKIYNYL